MRHILGITVSVLHGQPQPLATVARAIDYLQLYDASRPSPEPVLKYEIEVRYNNGDVVNGVFQTKDAAIDFLRRSTE